MANLAQTNPIQATEVNLEVCPAVPSSQYTSVTAALASDKRVCVDADSTEASFQLQEDETLYGHGGVITLTGPARISGNIESNVKIFDCPTGSDLHYYNGTQPFNVRWTGMRLASSSFGTANTEAFLCAWHMSRSHSVAWGGSEMLIAGGSYYVDPINIELDASRSHGDVGLRGRGGTLWLAPNSNKTLLKIDGFSQGALKETYIKDLFFEGNRANNTGTPADEPLVDISTYSLYMEGAEIRNSASDGLRLQNFQRYYLNNTVSSLNDGWGVVLDGVLGVRAINTNVESNKTGGIKVIGTSGEPRDYQTGILLDGIYAEGLAGLDVLRLEGVGNVEAKNFASVGDVRITKHPTLDQYSKRNVIDITGLRGSVFIDKGNCDNTIYRSRANLERGQIFDDDGKNSILNLPGQDVDSDFVSSRRSYNFPNMVAGMIHMSYPDNFGGSGVGNPFLATSNSHAVVTSATQGASSRLSLPQLGATSPGDYYWQVVADADHNVDTFVSILGSDGTYYNFDTCTWGADFNFRRIPTLECQWKIFQMPFEVDVSKSLTFQVWGKVWNPNEQLRVYYSNFSEYKNLGIYKNVNTVVTQVGEPTTL